MKSAGWMGVVWASVAAMGLAGGAAGRMSAGQAGLGQVGLAQGRAGDVEEAFALAGERGKVLGQLIPGSVEAYRWGCLERQLAGDLEGAAGILRAWEERHGRGGEWMELHNRQMLLGFAKDPEATWRWMREGLGLDLSHQAEVPGAKVDLPTALDPALVTLQAWERRAAEASPGDSSGFRGAALERLAQRELDDGMLASVMARLEYADLPGLPALVVRHLKLQRSGGFGSLEVHAELTLAQLEECARLEPKLLLERRFVEAWIARLAPGADEDSERDVAVRRAHLERLESFAGRLGGGFNTLKAQVLFRRLELDRRAGVHDLARFQAYLRLPRASALLHPRVREEAERSGQWAQTGERFVPGLDAIGDEQALVRALLEHFLRDASDTGAFDELVEPRYLARVFAETKILAGSGDMERWYSLLDDPAYHEELRQRVELRFAPTQVEHYGASDPVTIELDVKNVPTLLLKVYEVHALNWYTSQLREVDATIELDGLVANEERTFQYSESPFLRVRRRFELPSLGKPGVYVVEFIGNGTASRAVIRKGTLLAQERVSAAGHVFRVLDERGVAQPKAAVHVDGRRYESDASGDVRVPFSTKPGAKTVVLEVGERASLGRFQHREERYELAGGAFVEREALRAGETARIVARPILVASGVPVSLSVLEEPVLTIKTKNFEGVESSLDVRDLKLSDDNELVHDIAVPERLAELQVWLRAKVQSLATGAKIELSRELFERDLSKIAPSAQTHATLLGRNADGWFLDVLGRSGEPRPDFVMNVVLAHRDFDDFTFAVKTDANGRVKLGALDGVTEVAASGFPDDLKSWELDRERTDLPDVMHGIVGWALRVPFQRGATTFDRTQVSLMELNSVGAPVRDRFENLALAAGAFELRDLPTGDYRLVLKGERRSIDVVMTAGDVRDGWAYGKARALEVAERQPLHVRGISQDGEEIVIELAGAGMGTRLHVFATRYMPEFEPLREIGGWDGPDVREIELGGPECDLRAGRALSDEYRYILERRFARKFPGNMLQRPTLLLNPWALDEARTVLGIGGGSGGQFGGRRGGRAESKSRGVAAGGRGARWGDARGFADLGFLTGSRELAANVRSGRWDGLVRIPRASLGDGQHIHVLALDRGGRAYASLALAETPLVPRDLRLSSALDATRHLVERNAVDLVRAGETLRVDEAATEALQLFDSLDDVYQYFRARNVDSELERFAFLVRWPSLSVDEKRAEYSEHACHELNLFLQRKDPEFFASVVKPYLANKLEKNFLDHYLLGDELASYAELAAFRDLNIVERILLSQRVGREKAVQRHVRELVEALPPDLEERQFGFETALGSGVLANDADGFFVARGLREPGAPSAGKPMAPAPSEAPESGGPASPAPGMPGGGGGLRAGLAGEAEKKNKDAVAGDAPMRDAELAEQERNELGDDKSIGLLKQDMDDALARRQLQLLYQPVGATQVLAERTYWNVGRASRDSELVTANAFWNDFAAIPVGEPFVSSNFTTATHNLTEMLLALAVLDLPFKAGEQVRGSESGVRTLKPSTPLLAVRRELKDATKPDSVEPLLVSQNFFRLDDRYDTAGSVRRDKFVRDEFLVHVAYGCRVVVTNPTSATRVVELFTQVPAGAVALGGERGTRGRRVNLAPYSTESVEYLFYFPRAGRFEHYPVHVAQDEALVAFAEPASFNVVVEPSREDMESWSFVSQRGTLDQVLAFLERSNLERVYLPRIAWRMSDRQAFEAVVPRLRERFVFEVDLWSYSVVHKDVAAARELLENWTARFGASFAGPYLVSPLLVVHPVRTRAFEHLEFDPLVNPRAHPFGKRREVRNERAEAQWRELLRILCYKPELSAQDWLEVTYHLLLQDRIEDAFAAFAKVDASKVTERIQLDYLRAYLAFYGEQPETARAIAEPYREHPVQRWRALFGAVLAQLDEAAGRKAGASDETDREARQAALAASEPALDVKVEGARVTLAYANLAECELSYYPMDIEFLFSTNPFVGQDSRDFAYIRPRLKEPRKLAADARDVSFELPAELRATNVLLEVRAGGLVRRVPCLQGSLRVQWLERSGQLAVTEAASGKPQSKVYVKVYARLADGSVRFHKDGYTDLRGRFDYASMSGEGANDAQRYAVLVSSESAGAVIQEVAPPAR